MDHDPAIIVTDPQGSDNHDLVVGGGAGITSFFVPGDIDLAFRENNWSVAEMVEILTDIIRDATTRHIERRDGSVVEEPIISAREKMAAILMLDKKAKEGLILGGLIVKDRLTAKKTTADGTEVEYNAEGMRLTQEGSSRLKSTLALLEGASKATGDKIIDVDSEGVDVELERQNQDDSTSGSEPGDLRGDGVSGGQPSLVPRQPRGDDSDEGSAGAGSDGGPRGDSSGGDGLCGPLHAGEWAATGVTLPGGSGSGTGHEQDDQGTTKGAKDERGPRTTVQPGRSKSSQSTGDTSGRDRDGDQSNSSSPQSPLPKGVKPRRPIIPAESAAKRVNWWEPGIPRRKPGTKPSDYPDCVTAESIVDRQERIDRARKQAAEAAAGYLERRAKNLRSGSTSPNESRPGHGRPGAAPDPTGG